MLSKTLFSIFLLGTFHLFVACQQVTPGSNNQLRKLISTHRISSNHFVDIATDQQGNSYLASFQQVADKSDEIRIISLDSVGNIRWQLGDSLKGRATSIAMDVDQHIWVSGLYSGDLQFGEQHLRANHAAFVAQFDTSGQCLRLFGSEEGAIPTDIAVNAQGIILLGGRMGQQLHFGLQQAEVPQSESGFLAAFDVNGYCQWIHPLEGQINRIRANHQGRFLVAGHFYHRFSFRQDTLYTQDSYDQDGFLMQLTIDEQDYKLQRFGKPGHARKGYRSSEMVSDIAISPKGKVAFLSLTEKGFQEPGKMEELLELKLHLLDHNFQITQTHLIISDALSRNAAALTYDAQEHIWIAGKHGNEQSFLRKYQEDGQLMQSKSVAHGPNHIFRTAAFHRNGLVFSGHFQKFLNIEDLQIENKGEHAIFWYHIAE